MRPAVGERRPSGPRRARCALSRSSTEALVREERRRLWRAGVACERIHLDSAQGHVLAAGRPYAGVRHRSPRSLLVAGTATRATAAESLQRCTVPRPTAHRLDRHLAAPAYGTAMPVRPSLVCGRCAQRDTPSAIPELNRASEIRALPGALRLADSCCKPRSLQIQTVAVMRGRRGGCRGPVPRRRRRRSRPGPRRVRDPRETRWDGR